MATLHLISHTLHMHDEICTHLKHSLLPHDALLFLADGIYSTCLHLFTNYALFRLDSESTLCSTPPNITLQTIDYTQFVQLGIDYERHLSW
jgi:sulfur transfer complex TusBCD TusB component (DsrH family)